MEAILLTHDRQLGLAELVHKCYAQLWPGHPFIFRVPFSRAGDTGAFSYLSAQPNCRMIASAAGIKDSMAALLGGIDSREWVFWCIDDRFPIWLDPARLAQVIPELGTVPDEVEEVKLLRWREPLLEERLVIGATDFRCQAPGSRAYGFWHHHFVRAGLLRAVFLGPEVASDCRILAINQLIKDGEAQLFDGVAQVPATALVGLGEPLVAGRLTRNGRRWLKLMQCDVPAYRRVNREIEFG